MGSLQTRLGVLLLASAARLAIAQTSQVTGAGPASQMPVPPSPNGQSASQGVAYRNLASAQPLPPLASPVSQATVNYDAAVEQVTPLTSEQIRALRKRIDEAKRAARTSPTTPAKPVYSVQTVDLSPGAPPPIVRVSDLGSAVSFVDSTGQPWDIVEVDNMAKGRFDVLHPVKNVPTVTITANGSYVEGDVAVFLKGLSFPVVLKMIAGQRETDYRLDVRLPRRGPNSATPIRGEPSIALPDDSLQAVLDGTQSTSWAKQVPLENAPPGMSAWAVGNDRILLRTNLFLANPAWQGSIAGADGTRVYEIPRTPVVTVTDNGVSRNVVLDLE